jgi:L-threonylcarbamoyladenylate synthase
VIFATLKEYDNKNELIAIPTETVYGLAGNAYSDTAIRKIFELKKRPLLNPLIVHLKSASCIQEVASEIPEIGLKLINQFWPGPLTLILKKQKHISDLMTAGKDTVAVRVPNHPLTLALLNELEFPLTAPSANPFGSISPTNAEHVLSYFGKEIEAILDGGQCEKGLESTIIGFENEKPILYRHGAISMDEIEKEYISKGIRYNPVFLLENNSVSLKASGLSQSFNLVNSLK